MAFGLKPKYYEEYSLNNLTKEQFLVLAVEAAKKLGWKLGDMNGLGFMAYTDFSNDSWSEKITVFIELSLSTAVIKSECSRIQLIDYGENRGNVQHIISAINELRISLNSEALTQKYEELQPGFTTKELFKESSISRKYNSNGVLSILKPVKGYYVTPIIINLNIAVFLLMVVSGVNFFLPSTDSLLAWGANFRPLTLAGEWWRLITCCFLHIGIIHLLFNMYALAYIGVLLEPHLGKLRFISAYLLTGIISSVASLWWHDLIVSAGASGAIFGMYGVFLALLSTNVIDKDQRKPLLTSIMIFVVYNLANGMKGGIDNAAHVGGLVSGLIIGFAFVPSIRKPEEKKLEVTTVSLLTVAVIAISYFVYTKTPNDIGVYDNRMNEVSNLEKQALGFYSLPQTSPGDTLLHYLKDKGIKNWNEDIRLMDSLDKLNLPEAVHKRDDKLMKYFKLRLKAFDLMYKAIKENTTQYEDSINVYNTQIKTDVDDLNKE